MMMGYSEEKFLLTIFFEPHESYNSSLLMQLVLEEEWRKGTPVPDLKSDFFTKFATTRERFSVEFDYEYFEFVINFLKAIRNERKKNGIDATPIEDFLFKSREYCSVGQMIH